MVPRPELIQYDVFLKLKKKLYRLDFFLSNYIFNGYLDYF